MNQNRVNTLIKALKYLETAPHPVGAANLAEAISMASVEDLQQSFMRLAKIGVVKSRKGPKGGYTLVKPLNDIMYLDLAYALRYNKISDPLFQRAYGIRIEVTHV
jgi:DNA-binding IscR family transcriptional regulator